MGLADTMATKKGLFSKMKLHAKKLQTDDLQSRYGKKPDSAPVPGADEEAMEASGAMPADQVPDAADKGQDPLADMGHADVEPLDASGDVPPVSDQDVAPSGPGGTDAAVSALKSIDPAQLQAALIEVLSKMGSKG